MSWTTGTDNIEQHRPLLYSIAKRMTWAVAEFGLDEEDLIQEGYIGLMNAAERFDPRRGVKFVTYAFYYARVAMQRYIWRERKFHRVPYTSAPAYEGPAYAIEDPEEQQPRDYYLKFLPEWLHETFRCLYSGMTLQQTANIIGRTKTTAATRRNTIYTILKEALYP